MRGVIANQLQFSKIPGCSYAYWISNATINNFSNSKMENVMVTRTGMATADNDKFLKFWFEVTNKRIYFTATDYINAMYTGFKWFPYNKGGDFRRWYGNNEYIVNWENNGSEVKNNKDPKTGRIRSHNYNGEYSFEEGLTWTELSSGVFSLRYCPKGYLFDSAGAKAFIKEKNNTWYILGCLNSKVAQHYLDFLAPTLHYKPGDINLVPFIKDKESKVEKISTQNVDITKNDWDSFETSWDFKKHPLI